MFKIGDMVVYGGSGICRVMDISTLDMEGVPKDRVYYILKPSGRGDSRIFAPVENNRTVMRRVLSRDEADALIGSIPDIELLPNTDDKNREATYRECIKSCDCRSLVQIIKTLYSRSRARVEAGKKVSSLDERYLKQAEDFLYAELSIPLGVPKEEMSAYIASRLEQL